ncbi:MAG: VWA domain-containing protein, partial [Candidatus Avoscillospira sp.]
MKKRCLAALLALVMIVSVLPFSAFAVDGDALNGITYNDKTSAAATGVEANKTAVLNDDGTYTITLSVTGDTQTSTTTQKLPADIVLVVDTSTSMDEAVTYKTCGGRIVKKEGKNGHKKYVCELCEEDYEKEDLGSTCTEKVKDKNRLDVAKEAATAFVTGLFDVQGMDIRFGLCDFSGTPRTYVSLTNDEEALLAAIQNLHMPEDGDGTHYDVGLGSENVDYGAYSILKDSPESREKFIVFISDGEPSRGHSGVTEANTLKGMGVTIFSVGVDIRAGGNGETALRAICSKDENGNDYYYAASSNGESGTLLTDVLNQIKKEIESKVHAGKDAVMTDVINSNSFELVDGPLSEGLTLDQSGNIVWNIDDITKDTKTVTFKVRLKEDNTACGEIPTNADVNLTFTDASGNHVTFTKNAIGDPKVKVNKVTYTDGLEETVFADEVYYNYILGSDIPSFSKTTVPVPDGYEFAGWNRSDDSDGNITFTAVYRPDASQTKTLSYTVEYYKDGVKVDA